MRLGITWGCGYRRPPGLSLLGEHAVHRADLAPLGQPSYISRLAFGDGPRPVLAWLATSATYFLCLSARA